MSKTHLQDAKLAKERKKETNQHDYNGSVAKVLASHTHPQLNNRAV